MKISEIDLAYHLAFIQGGPDMSCREFYNLFVHSNISPEVASHVALNIRGDEKCNTCGKNHNGYICPEQY